MLVKNITNYNSYSPLCYRKENISQENPTQSSKTDLNLSMKALSAKSAVLSNQNNNLSFQAGDLENIVNKIKWKYGETAIDKLDDKIWENYKKIAAAIKLQNTSSNEAETIERIDKLIKNTPGYKSPIVTFTKEASDHVINKLSTLKETIIQKTQPIKSKLAEEAGDWADTTTFCQDFIKKEQAYADRRCNNPIIKETEGYIFHNPRISEAIDKLTGEFITEEKSTNLHFYSERIPYNEPAGVFMGSYYTTNGKLSHTFCSLIDIFKDSKYNDQLFKSHNKEIDSIINEAYDIIYDVAGVNKRKNDTINSILEKLDSKKNNENINL